MSDLQIGLLIVGVLIVAGVIAFNWVQERRFHQRAEAGFKRPEADLLLERQSDPRIHEDLEKRIDPHFEPQIPETNTAVDETVEEEHAATVNAAPPANVPQEDVPQGSVPQDEPEAETSLGYIAEIRSGEAVPATTIDAIEQVLEATGRRHKISGYDYHTRKWGPVSDPTHWYTSIRIFIQAVDRSGAVTREQLERVAALLIDQAEAISGIAELPDLENVLSTAAALDEFCVNVDVIVGLSVISRPGQVLHGTQLRALAEANGLKLNANGVFILPDLNGNPLFTLDNQESNPFATDELKNLVTSGVTFLLDVPRTPDGLRVFNKMVAVARQFADSLDGALCDDNRVTLNDTGLEKIRDQLRSIYETMEQRGISAGSESALHLFS